MVLVKDKEAELMKDNNKEKENSLSTLLSCILSYLTLALRFLVNYTYFYSLIVYTSYHPYLSRVEHVFIPSTPYLYYINNIRTPYYTSYYNRLYCSHITTYYTLHLFNPCPLLVYTLLHYTIIYLMRVSYTTLTETGKYSFY